MHPVGLEPQCNCGCFALLCAYQASAGMLLIPFICSALHTPLDSEIFGTRAVFHTMCSRGGSRRCFLGTATIDTINAWHCDVTSV